MTVRIVSDSCCDLPDDLNKKYIIEVVPLLVNLDGVGNKDSVDIDRREFYDKLPHFKDLPQSSSPSPEAFRAGYD